MEHKIKELLEKHVNLTDLNDVVKQIILIVNESENNELNSRRNQITDINQWSEILLKYRGKIRERVLWSMISDINNRTTD